MKCILAVAVVLAIAEGKVLPNIDTAIQQTEDQPFSLTDHIQQAKTLLENLGTQLHNQLSLPNQEELTNTIKTQSNNFAENVKSFLENMTEEIKNKKPELENVMANLQTKLSDMTKQLNISPETMEQASQLREKFQQGIQTILTESENTAKSFNDNSAKVQEGIAKFTKEAVDIAVQASQNLNNQLQQATAPQH